MKIRISVLSFLVFAYTLFIASPLSASGPPCPTSITPTGYPTVCATATINQFKIVISTGSGFVGPASSDASYIEGITQSPVTKPSVGNFSTVPIASTGLSYVLVGGSRTTVSTGNIVTSDANGNAIRFAPAADGNQHCALGTVVAVGPLNGATGDLIQVSLAPFCLVQPISTGPALNFSDNETPTGLINGSNVTFTLANTPNPPGSLTIIGVTASSNPNPIPFFQVPALSGSFISSEYTLSGNTITFDSAPSTGSNLKAWYRF